MPLALGQMQPPAQIVAGQELVAPTLAMPAFMNQFFPNRFLRHQGGYAVRAELVSHPGALAQNTALYAALSRLSALCVFGYALTGKARFAGDGDKVEQNGSGSAGGFGRFLSETHPDAAATRGFEMFAGAAFLVAAPISFQPACAKLAFAFMLQPILQRRTWDIPLLRHLDDQSIGVPSTTRPLAS